MISKEAVERERYNKLVTFSLCVKALAGGLQDKDMLVMLMQLGVDMRTAKRLYDDLLTVVDALESSDEAPA